MLFLEDASLENGCLWARAGSHREPLRKRWERNEAWFDAVAANRSTAGVDAMTFVNLDSGGASPVDVAAADGTIAAGGAPTAETARALRAMGYAPLPVKAGDLVVVHGITDHLSLSNTGTQSRHTFQLHLIEDGADSRWRRSNWQQYDAAIKTRGNWHDPALFPRLDEASFPAYAQGDEL